MKIDCPICGKMGFVQVRGKNVMIQHYQGFEGGKRIYQYHKVPYEQFQELQVNATASKESTSKLQVRKEPVLSREAAIGAFGGIWTRDHYLTKVTPHRARLRRLNLVLL